MIEVEVKVKADHAAVKKIVLEKGAVFSGVEEQADVYFNSPSRDFSKTDEALRVRLVNGAGEITYKGPKLDKVSKTRTEYNCPADAENIISILLALGFFKSGAVAKRREIYKLDDFLIGFDTVKDLGEYMEVETDVSDGSSPEEIKGATDKIFRFLKSLGIEKDASIKQSYLE
ncbi:class IV adenylate cyclase [Methanolapillus millepedarum]|uniref:CYTH domain-containing protein n=1 Tax=Methanolapillus millepedarum TaxID=3028296 RepID=A0AA96VD85_9EURY|nr:hypothetical protein MsAc7_01090 [Methanosarcinaceae archaeon Ac7]